ncbi:MAG: CRISPR system precrRNA processing endoribonuclease RAMP protein Cas6 [Caldimicrobium sp.]|nr:CRISPR system precrRNA processing endoribonuclease RAMP protein Cas6 [Caldimicrobium sp.]
MQISFKDILIPFITFQVIYQFELRERISLPEQIYSEFRGILGKNLKQISCVLRTVRSCLDCQLNSNCPYSYIFETVRPPETERLKKYPYLPHPFSFFIPYPLTHPSLLEINLVLIGKGINFFPHFVLALENLTENFYPQRFKKLKLLKILNPLTKATLNRETYLKLPEPVNLENFYIPETSEILFQIVSPLELKFQGKYVKLVNFSFSVLIRNLLRRISSLSYFHCQKELKLDFRKIIEESEKVEIVESKLKTVVFKRKSYRTGQTHPLCGLVGSCTFKGNLKPFYSLLLLGSFLQVGKHTSFGFGKYDFSPAKGINY